MSWHISASTPFNPQQITAVLGFRTRQNSPRLQTIPSQSIPRLHHITFRIATYLGFNPTQHPSEHFSTSAQFTPLPFTSRLQPPSVPSKSPPSSAPHQPAPGPSNTNLGFSSSRPKSPHGAARHFSAPPHHSPPQNEPRHSKPRLQSSFRTLKVYRPQPWERSWPMP